MPSKDQALDLIPDPSQRQLLEALADTQSLPDDHPTWTMIAMTAVVMNGSRSELDSAATELARLKSEITELKTQVDRITRQLSRIEQILSDAAQLSERMPRFQKQLGEAIGTVLQRINNIDSKSPRPK